MAKTTGSWKFQSNKDPRWNCEGTYAVRINMDHPREAMERFVALQMELGDPPDDFTQIYMASGLVSEVGSKGW